MELSPPELRFLLRLLEYAPDYRTRISQIKLGKSKDPTSERNNACKDLCSKGLVAYLEEIQRYRIEPPGKALLKSDTSTLPVSAEELELLKVAATKAATPGQAKKVPADERQRLLNQLKDRGLITASKVQIKDVWLTPQGIQFLLNDCTPKSPNAKLPFSMLGHYLAFMRKSLGQLGVANHLSSEDANLQEDQAISNNGDSLSPQALLDTIRQLDQQLNTDNFLPIFHLREKLQPPISREELDQMLYELQGEDLIELSTLQDVSNYREEQIAAGIPQNIGGALFYISLIN